MSVMLISLPEVKAAAAQPPNSSNSCPGRSLPACMQAASTRGAHESADKPGPGQPALVRCLTLQPKDSSVGLRFFSVRKPKQAGKGGKHAILIYVLWEELRAAVKDAATCAIIAQLSDLTISLNVRQQLVQDHSTSGAITLSAAP